MGINSKLLAVACEVHWSVPERFRSRQMDIKLKECLHAALRENNRRILGLNSCYEDIVDPWNTFNISPFPLVLAKSRTEESCARDADTDSFQGIYRRFYPALLSLQDQSTVDAHKGYWTLENMRDETKSPLIPTPAKFLFHQSQEQLNKRSVVALNLAVLRLRGDNRDYDNDEKRIKNKEMKPRKSIVQIDILDYCKYFCDIFEKIVLTSYLGR
uniref:Uncharacterized protein n=1 Tax=Meloidogyne incognita TaxID=6306 RepID=A0A914LGP2_MELIC